MSLDLLLVRVLVKTVHSCVYFSPLKRWASVAHLARVGTADDLQAYCALSEALVSDGMTCSAASSLSSRDK